MLEMPTQRAGFGVVANHVLSSSISTYLCNYIALKIHSQNRTILPLYHLRCFLDSAKTQRTCILKTLKLRCIEDQRLLFAAEVELASSCSRRLSEDHRPVRSDNDIHRQVAHSFPLFIRSNHASVNAPQSIYLRNVVVLLGPLTAVHKLLWILERLDSTVFATTLK